MTLASLCSWAGRFESYLVGNPRRQVFSWCGSNVNDNVQLNGYSMHFLEFFVYFQELSICLEEKQDNKDKDSNVPLKGKPFLPHFHCELVWLGQKELYVCFRVQLWKKYVWSVGIIILFFSKNIIQDLWKMCICQYIFAQFSQ